MLADIALHFALDMSGAASFACLVRGCRNPEHQHNAVVRWVAGHVWLVQAAVALVLAYVTVSMIG